MLLAKICSFFAFIKFLRVTSLIGGWILVPYVKMEIFRYDKVDFLKTFSTSHLTEFQSQKQGAKRGY